ncbi:MAG: alpha/beta hydrolase [Protaetiibacter sp.]
MTDPTTLEPGIRAWLARIAELDTELPAVDSLDFAARRDRERRLSDRLAAEFSRPVDPGARIEETEIAGRYAHRIRPRGSGGPLPTQLFLHGGGFVSGTARELANDSVLSERSVAAGVQIISIDYRLAPEHPYPAAVDDALAVLDALADDPVRWGADADRLGVGGGSAGGHVAAVACLRLRERERAGEGGARLIHALLEVPALDLTADWPSVAEFASPGEIEGAQAVAAAYRGTGPVDDWFAPVRVDDLSGLPRTLVMTAEFDPLRDAAEGYARRLAAAGVDAELRRGIGQLHGTQGLTAAVASTQRWQDAAIAELRLGYAAGR